MLTSLKMQEVKDQTWNQIGLQVRFQVWQAQVRVEKEEVAVKVWAQVAAQVWAPLYQALRRERSSPMKT